MNAKRLRLLGPSLGLAALTAAPILFQGSTVGSGEAVTVVAVVGVLALGSTQLPDRVDRRLMAAAAVAAGAATWRLTTNDVVATAGWVLHAMAPWFLLHLVTRQLGHAVRPRVGRTLVRMIYLVPLAGGALWSLTWSPTQGWRSVDGPTLVRTLGDRYLVPTFDTPWISDTADAIVSVAFVAAAALVLWMTIGAYRRERQSTELPVLVASAGYVGALALSTGGMHLWADGLLGPDATQADRALVLLLDPLSFLVCSGVLGATVAFAPALRRALIEARVTPLGGADHPIDDRTLTETLRHLIDDPSLHIRYPDPEPAIGHESPERTTTEIVSGGRPIAWIEHREDADPAAVELAAHVVATAIDNTASHAALRAAAEDLERSKERIAQAAEAERTRFATQARGEPRRLLDEASRLLDGADRPVAERAPDRVVEARTRLERALMQLRALAHGLRPAVLNDLGLVAALDELADRSTVPCIVDPIQLNRVEPEVEAAAYALAQTLLTQIDPTDANGTVRIVAQSSESQLTVVIDAPLPPESVDLELVADRIAALCGRLTIAPTERGFQATAHLPTSSQSVTA